MNTKTNATVTLRDLAGTGRGLGSLTIEDLRALLAASEPAKRAPKKAAPKKAVTRKPAPKAAKAKAAPKEPSAFYTEVIVGKRDEREARKSTNRDLAAWMRSEGLEPVGSAWAAAKAGERDVDTLRALTGGTSIKPQAAKAPRKAAPAKAATPKPKAEPKPKAAKAKAAKAKAAPKAPVSDEREAILVAAGFTEAEARLVLGL